MSASAATQAPPSTPQYPPRITAELVKRLVGRIAAGIADGSEPKTVTTHAPFTGAPIADLPLSSPADVAAAFERARDAQRAWASRPIADRARIFLRFHDLVLDRQDEVLDLIQWENGKARKHAFAEVIEPPLVARYYARRAHGFLGPRRAAASLPGISRAVEVRYPRGVVGLISPWNYPLVLGVEDAIPALIAGNAVVSKPDTQTALTLLWVHELAERAGLPAQLWQVVVGAGPVVGTAVVDHADFVGFTGSTRTGREIARKAGARLVPYSLELGGKNPMIVCPDANLGRTVQGAVDACFSSTGQLCVAAERMYVHTDIYDQFVPSFAAAVARMRLGAGYDYAAADMGSLLSQAQLDKVHAHVADAVARGATVLAGGNPRPDLGPYFFEPTVLTDVTEDMVVCTEETFGPVVSVYRYADTDEVVARANATPYGLNASIWTGNPRRGRRLAARLKAGTVNVNDGYAASYGTIDAPMGGMKDSGVGRRHGRDGILKYTEPQTIVVQRFVVGVEPPLGLRFDRWAGLLTRALRLLKRTGHR
ncbi:MAG: succinate-semialdehyde dehydrogenase (NADP(+)) [Sporichthyaceae bacterium]|nr:succinate-semialdehyde dehydrogenase (NADP(+)) [Sporichthyaceae bacterium]